MGEGIEKYQRQNSRERRHERSRFECEGEAFDQHLRRRRRMTSSKKRRRRKTEGGGRRRKKGEGGGRRRERGRRRWR